MKRFFAILLCFFILTFNTISVKAMDIGVAIEVGQEVFYAGWDQVMALINGVVIPTSQYAGAADKTVAMAAFYDDWLGTLSGLTQYWGGDIAESETSAISINYPLDYGMSGRYANNFLTEYANLTQDVNNGFALPLNGNILAAWNRYNNLWIQRYLNSFNGTNDIPTPNPDLTYKNYLDIINGTDINSINSFFFSDYPSTSDYGGGYVANALHYPFTSYSYFDCSGTGITSYDGTTPCYISDIIDVRIYSLNDLYTFTYTPTKYEYACELTGNYWNAIRFRYPANGFYDWETAGSNYAISEYSRSGSLTEVLSYIGNHFRNVNIYVDDVLWSYVGGDFVEKITAPDVIRNESGQIIGNDVYVPEQDLMIDLINWQNLVDDKILSGEDITFDDLIDAGVITDSEGNIIDQNDLDSYFKKKSISGVIDDALDDTEAIALVPDLPVPPDPGNTDPFNWNFPEFIPDIPDVNFTPRQTGLTVLARIINVTNKSLPGEVIAMFWGIVITLVILGIIKIAHK